MFIVDARVRPPIRMFAESQIFDVQFVDTSRRKRHFGMDSAVEHKSVDMLFQQMQDAGINHAVVPGRAANPSVGGGHPESLVELMRQKPGFVTGLAGTDASTIQDVPAFIDDVIKSGFKGIVVESGLSEAHVPVDHHSNFPLYEAAQAHGLVVYAMGGGSSGPDISFSDPLSIDRVAMNFPNLQIVIPHGGFPYVQEVCGVMYRRANVWLLPDCYFPGLPGETDYLLCAKGYGQDRFLFGTSYPFTPHSEQIRRYLELPLSDSIKEKIMGLNAARLFGLK